jgi:hypothetical protein
MQSIVHAAVPCEYKPAAQCAHAPACLAYPFCNGMHGGEDTLLQSASHLVNNPLLLTLLLLVLTLLLLHPAASADPAAATAADPAAAGAQGVGRCRCEGPRGAAQAAGVQDPGTHPFTGPAGGLGVEGVCRQHTLECACCCVVDVVVVVVVVTHMYMK